MTTKNITGVVNWLKGWFYDKEEITSKEQALQTQINNKASTSDLATTNGNVSNLASQLSGKANQSDLNITNNNLSALESKVDSLDNVDLLEIVQSLPTASASTMNCLYIVTNGGTTPSNLYSIYVTVDNDGEYSWEKIDDADLQGFITSDTANATFALKSHDHGSITNDGKVVGAAANKPLITTTGGAVTAGSFEGTATNIKMNGTQAVGSRNTFARGDHVHPVDTSRAPNDHASSANTYGVGTPSVYGHVKTINSLTQASHTDGTALSAFQGKVLKGLVDGCVADIELVPKTTDATGAIKLIYSDE